MLTSKWFLRLVIIPSPLDKFEQIQRAYKPALSLIMTYLTCSAEGSIELQLGEPQHFTLVTLHA